MLNFVCIIISFSYCCFDVHCSTKSIFFKRISSFSLNLISAICLDSVSRMLFYTVSISLRFYRLSLYLRPSPISCLSYIILSYSSMFWSIWTSILRLSKDVFYRTSEWLSRTWRNCCCFNYFKRCSSWTRAFSFISLYLASRPHSSIFGWLPGGT